MSTKKSEASVTPKNGDKTGRDAKGRFTKGNSGGGRRPIPEDVLEMMKAACPAATQLLIDTMNDPNARLDLRIDCAETLLDRVYGKAKQAVNIDASNLPRIVIAGEEQIRE